MCFTQLNDHEETYSSCPYCCAKYDQGENFSTDIYLINCLNPNCDGFVEYDDTECTKCRVEFTEQDWDLYLQQASPSEVEAIKNSYSNDDPIMVCCHKSWAECLCDKPVSWDDTDQIPVHVWDKVYSDNFSNDCGLCEYQYTEQCLPLANFVVNFVADGVIGEPLTVCSDFHEEWEIAGRSAERQSLMTIDYGEF